MRKFSRKIAKIGLVLCTILLILGVIFNDIESVQFYSIIFGVNLIALFMDRIMDDIQKILDVIYNYINK